MTALHTGTKHLMDIAPRPPQVFVRGRGSWLEDAAGCRYLDFVQGWAVNCLGHAPDVLAQALADQARTLINPSPAFYNARMCELASLLAEASGLGRVFFANCGAEANEGAIKLARKWGALHRAGAYEIVTFDHAFHGRTLATMSASGKAQWDGLFEPRVPGFPKARLNDMDSVRACVTDRTAAVMLEPIQGEAGVIPARDAFLQDLRQYTRARGLLLILDEIQTGMGRTGRLFAFQHAGIDPDVLTLGKGLGGGVPLAALLAKEEYCCFAAGDQGGTFNGNPLMTAAGCAVMRTLTQPGFLAAATSTGEYLRERLTDLAARRGLGEVRGRGLLLALDLGRDVAKAVAARALETGLLINAPQPGTLRFMPALTVTRAEIDAMLGLLDTALAEVCSGESA